MPRLIFRRPDEEIVVAAATLAFEEDKPPAPIILPWALRAPISQDAEDTGILGGPAFEEDRYVSGVTPVAAGLYRDPTQRDNEDVGVLGLAIEEEPSSLRVSPAQMIWRQPAAVDDDLPVATSALVLEEDSPAPPVALGWRPAPVTAAVDDDLPVTAAAAIAYEDESGPPVRALGWTPPPAPRPLEDDVPVLFGPFEEDSFALPKPIPPFALNVPRGTTPDTYEDVPRLHGAFEEDRWLSGVAPILNWRWVPPSPDGDWTPQPPGVVPNRAYLTLAAKNRCGLALADNGASFLALADAGRVELALVENTSRLSLASLGELFLSLVKG